MKSMDVGLACSEDSDYFYHVTPDEVDELVAALQQARNPNLTIEPFPQHAGTAVYALTFTDPAVPRDRKKGVFVARPHAHEPAGVAACTELAKLLAGYGPRPEADAEWRAHVLKRFVLTLVPDVNPGGSRRAPVKFWTGTQIPREQFKLWMFGESGGTPGERFPRVDTWDMRKVTPPKLLGIAYEQINEHEFVEPNRDHRSTLFRSFFALDPTWHYELWLDLHQTEFANSDRNCSVHLSSAHDTLPVDLQRGHEQAARAILAQWSRAGARPVAEPVVSYRHDEVQRNFLAKAWLPISSRMVHTVTEVQNHNPATPPAEQVRLQLIAVLAALDWLDGQA
ncbi:MAG: hypothetical protein JXR37_36580 [Kiritimatiellae bacterium]|nr:hypothetical protein [Kiritimatiellia bacterium]